MSHNVILIIGREQAEMLFSQYESVFESLNNITESKKFLNFNISDLKNYYSNKNLKLFETLIPNYVFILLDSNSLQLVKSFLNKIEYTNWIIDNDHGIFLTKQNFLKLNFQNFEEFIDYKGVYGIPDGDNE